MPMARLRFVIIDGPFLNLPVFADGRLRNAPQRLLHFPAEILVTAQQLARFDAGLEQRGENLAVFVPTVPDPNAPDNNRRRF